MRDIEKEGKRRWKKLKRIEKNIKNESERKKMKGVLNPEKIRSNGIAGRVGEFKVIEKKEVER